MPRTAFNVRVQIPDIFCREEADGIGDAEPYLWPVLFKIDGDNYVVARGLTGNPFIAIKHGDHGNLADTDVDAFALVRVPEALGVFETTLWPIPVVDPTYRAVLGDDLPGIVGIVAVLMEQDGWPDELATTGYAALVDAVQLGVAKFVTKYQHRPAPPTPNDVADEIEALKAMATKMVSGAIKEKMGGDVFVFGTAGNNDDTLGAEAWYVNQDQLTAKSLIEFQRTWTDDETKGCGEWRIRVLFRNLDAPPDTSECPDLAARIDSLEEELAQETDLNERKKIQEKIAELKRRQKLIGCL